jgi:hypothetical protein
MICCAIHSAAGHAEFLCRGVGPQKRRTASETRWFERRRSRMPIYFDSCRSGNSRHPGDGPRLWRLMYLATVLAETLNPNLASSALTPEPIFSSARCSAPALLSRISTGQSVESERNSIAADRIRATALPPSKQMNDFTPAHDNHAWNCNPVSVELAGVELLARGDADRNRLAGRNQPQGHASCCCGEKLHRAGPHLPQLFSCSSKLPGSVCGGSLPTTAPRINPARNGTTTTTTMIVVVVMALTNCVHGVAGSFADVAAKIESDV